MGVDYGFVDVAMDQSALYELGVVARPDILGRVFCADLYRCGSECLMYACEVPTGPDEFCRGHWLPRG